MEPNPEIDAHRKAWGKIYRRCECHCIGVSSNMQTSGWIEAINTRVRRRAWALLSRDTLMHYMDYHLRQMMNNTNLGVDIGHFVFRGFQ